MLVGDEESTAAVGLTGGTTEADVGEWVEGTFVSLPAGPDDDVEEAVDLTELVGEEGNVVLFPVDGTVFEGAVDLIELVLLPPDVTVVEGVVDLTVVTGTVVEVLEPLGMIEGERLEVELA